MRGKKRFNDKELTEEGEEWEGYAEVMEDQIDFGRTRKEVIAGINYVGQLNSMDLGDELDLFLAGVDYGKTCTKKTKKFVLPDKNEQSKLNGGEDDNT
ncbi:hypothetical protein LCGC14_1858450 [marine sediment metagenome]|uniref:Uncharacterized protein n=1 Tax=marine sediment metagenome TaxID=412755 RepID=A0A0F9IMM7_9ZZZZ